jgi:hypothetical protein
LGDTYIYRERSDRGERVGQRWRRERERERERDRQTERKREKGVREIEREVGGRGREGER